MKKMVFWYIEKLVMKIALNNPYIRKNYLNEKIDFGIVDIPFWYYINKKSYRHNRHHQFQFLLYS